MIQTHYMMCNVLVTNHLCIPYGHIWILRMQTFHRNNAGQQQSRKSEVCRNIRLDRLENKTTWPRHTRDGKKTKSRCEAECMLDLSTSSTFIAFLDTLARSKHLPSPLVWQGGMVGIWLMWLGGKGFWVCGWALNQQGYDSAYSNWELVKAISFCQQVWFILFQFTS